MTINPEYSKTLSKFSTSFPGLKEEKEILNSLFVPSNKLTELLEKRHHTDISILKEIYFTQVPSFIDNLKIRFIHSKLPILTIITSVFKGDEYIEEFLKNTTEQVGFELFELILVNCNSPGSEDQIILPYVEKFDNIKYIKLNQDPGLYDAWNLCLEEGTAEFVTNANLDDRKSRAYYLLLLNELISQNADIASSLFWTCNVLPEKNPRDLPIVWYKNINPNPSWLDFVKLNDKKNGLLDHCFLGPMPLWRKVIHKVCGKFNEKLYGPSSDYAMWFKAIQNGFKARVYKVPLAFYLKSQGSYARRSDVSNFNLKIISDHSWINSNHQD